MIDTDKVIDWVVELIQPSISVKVWPERTDEDVTMPFVGVRLKEAFPMHSGHNADVPHVLVLQVVMATPAEDANWPLTKHQTLTREVYNAINGLPNPESTQALLEATRGLRWFGWSVPQDEDGEPFWRHTQGAKSQSRGEVFTFRVAVCRVE